MSGAHETTRCAMFVAVALSCLLAGGQTRALTAGGPTRALTGNQLWEACDASRYIRDDPRAIACVYYILGASEVYKTFLDPSSERPPALANLPKLICLSPDVVGEQLTDAVTLYLHDHPEERHLAAVELVASALKEKFPCNAR
jgi:Rap1a immunity proteins